ncbi:MAG TPA: hypothetical protein PLA50_06765 [Bacteroidia bacterium]|nr:hypothetical protein [Bacteroidia bacterium]
MSVGWSETHREYQGFLNISQAIFKNKSEFFDYCGFLYAGWTGCAA